MERFARGGVMLAITLLFVAGCVKKGPSQVCEGDNECEAELSCLPVSDESGGTCAAVSDICTEECTSDQDCADLGDEFRCLSQCDGTSVCGEVEVQTSDLPASAVCEATANCAEGLECLPVAEHDGDMCTEVGLACSTTCETDADCTDLGPEFRCFDGCGDDKSCGATG